METLILSCSTDSFQSETVAKPYCYKSLKAKGRFLPAVSSLLGVKVCEERLTAMHIKAIENMGDVSRSMVGDGADDKMALLNAELQKVRKEG